MCLLEFVFVAFILGCSVGVCSSETDYQLQNQEMVEGVFKPQGSKDISITKDIRLFQDTVVLEFSIRGCSS